MAAGKKSGRKSQASNDFLEPLAPTGVTATDVGTGRAYNDGAAIVSFSLPELSPAATSYTVTASTSQTATGSSSPITVPGLSSDTSVTFTVTATNAAGTSQASSASSAITITTVPATPSAPSASTVGGTAQDFVSWSAPANGGKAITNYHWTSSDGKSGDTGSTSVTVNQEAGTAQTYNVYATNANGNSGTSADSGSVTTFSFTPFSFTPYSFVPVFSFTPFSFTPYSFVPYSFVPFSFVPFSFVPYSFVPTFSFTPFSFTPYSFTPIAYSFTPLTTCIDEDTLIQIVGENNSVEYKAAKDIKLGDKIWSINWTGLKTDIEDPFAEHVYGEVLESVSKVPSEIVQIEPSAKDFTVIINGDLGKRFSAEEKVLVKRGSTHQFIEAKLLTDTDIIFESTENGMRETQLISVEYIDEPRTVFKFNAYPVDTIIAGNMIVHNRKVL